MLRDDVHRPRRESCAPGRARLLVVAVMVVCGAVLSLTPSTAARAGTDDPPPPPVTVNEFLPENRDLSDCLNSLPKPDCGSDAQGGWHQTLVLLAIVAGLGVIGWRIVVGARRARVTADDQAPDD